MLPDLSVQETAVGVETKPVRAPAQYHKSYCNICNGKQVKNNPFHMKPPVRGPADDFFSEIVHQEAGRVQPLFSNTIQHISTKFDSVRCHIMV